MVVVGGKTYIPVLAAGKLSRLPLDWWRRRLEDAGPEELTTLEGACLTIETLGATECVELAASYNKEGLEVVLGRDVFLYKWSGSRIRAGDLRVGEQLRGIYGMYVVQKCRGNARAKVIVPAWRVNVCEVGGLHVAVE